MYCQQIDITAKHCQLHISSTLDLELVAPHRTLRVEQLEGAAQGTHKMTML